MVGVDGNKRTYIAIGALLLDETASTFHWVFQVAQELLGAQACAAVRVIVRDEDWGETKALFQRVYRRPLPPTPQHLHSPTRTYTTCLSHSLISVILSVRRLTPCLFFGGGVSFSLVFFGLAHSLYVGT
jgi:hypothetical protein